MSLINVTVVGPTSQTSLFFHIPVDVERESGTAHETAQVSCELSTPAEINDGILTWVRANVDEVYPEDRLFLRHGIDAIS